MKPLKTAEMELREKLEGEGWVVTHKGWPDFACVRGGEMMFVEVKGYRGEMLKEQQHYILTNLARLGLDCYKWSPDCGFEQITPSTPMPKTKRKGRKRPTLEEKLAHLSPEEREHIENLEAEGKTVYL